MHLPLAPAISTTLEAALHWWRQRTMWRLVAPAATQLVRLQERRWWQRGEADFRHNNQSINQNSPTNQQPAIQLGDKAAPSPETMCSPFSRWKACDEMLTWWLDREKEVSAQIVILWFAMYHSYLSLAHLKPPRVAGDLRILFRWISRAMEDEAP